MNLQDLKTKGVKELTVQNGEAIAVNPYEIDYSIEEDANWTGFALDPTLSTPAHCPSVSDGVYEIEKFEEEVQVKSLGEWNNSKVNKIEFSYDGRETRTVIRLKQQAPENHSVEVNDMVEGKLEVKSEYILRRELQKERGYGFTDIEWNEYFDNSINDATIRAMEEYASIRVQQAQGWISIETDKGFASLKDCLVLCDNGDIRRFMEDWPFAIITHWQPLPEPPK